MKSKLNYKSRKTIIITVAIIVLLALSATGIYVFTKGNDKAEAFAEGNTMVDGSSQNGSEGTTNPEEEQTVEPNEGSENVGEGTETTPNTENTATGITTGTGATTGTGTTTTGNVPNGEYVTERQEEVERLTYEGFLVGWTPISLTALTDDIDLNKAEQQPSYTITKVATLVNGNALERDENGKIITKVQPGDKVTYVITVENTGNVTLQNIEVSDELVGYEETIAVLAIGDKKEITVEYTVNQDDMDENEEIVNTVKAVVPNPTNPEEIIEENDEEEVPVNPYITVSGNKTWVDNGNLENTRPEKITVEVLNGETVVDTITVRPAQDGTWSYTSKELPKYADKNATTEIVYTVREANVDSKYTATAGTGKYDIVNTIKDSEIPTVTVSGSKTWVDYNNQENTRPASITVEVLNGETVVDTITVRPAQDGTWSYTSKELPKYADKNATTEIVYTVREANVDSKYTATAGTGKYDIVNTIKDSEIPTVTVSGSKTWVDYNNQENTRPASITVEVLNGETVVDTITVRPAQDGTWSYTSKELPKYADKNATTEIVYTVREANVDSKYTATAGIGKYDIVNTIKDSEIPTVTVSGSKTWVDYNNKENTRPASITVEVLNGETVVDTITVRPAQDGTWSYTSKELPKYADKNATTEIVYTVREANVDSKYTATAGTGKYDIVNTIKDSEIPTVTVSGSKTWVDYNNQENTRPASITVEVLNGETVVDTITVRPAQDGTWSYTSKELPKYADKNATTEIVYTVREANVDSKYTATAGTGKYDIVNTIKDSEIPTVTVSGSKTWVDYNNQENTRPASITVEVLNGETVVDTITVRPAQDGTWSYTSKELPKYADKNATTEIVYTVREANVDSKYTATAGIGKYDIVNTLKDSEIPTVTVSGSKTWVDYNNKENTRPASITVEVLNGETVVDTITVRPAQDGTWSYTSKELPKYADKNATTEIVYTVREANVDSKYTATAGTGKYDIVNTIKDSEIPTVTVSGSKTWVDYNNQENTRPASITVEVLNGETVVDTITVTAENGWSYTSKTLPKYADKNATKPIEYTVRETAVAGYTTTYSGNNVINTVDTVPTVTVSGTKTWVDYNNQENTRPTSITVEVLNGETVVDTITVTAENGWSYTSKTLPKYADKNATKPIEYTVREANVDSKYTATAGTGKYDIVNTLKETPKTQITVSKVWSDGNNQDGNRPASVKVQLFVGDEEQGNVVTLTENNKLQADENIWQYTFTGLDKYNSKNEVINYEVKEVISSGNAIANNGTNGDYTVTYEKDTENKVMTITNSYTPKTTSVTVTKVWEDNNDEDNDRPSSITIKLYDGSNVVNVEPVVTKQGSIWTYTFSNLPMYNAGRLITYTAKELRTDGTIVADNAEYNENYVTTYSGNTITNTHVKPVITVTKTSNETNQDVEYGDTIKYTLRAKNTGTKAGKVTIKDTIPTGTELTGDINVTVGGTTTTITTSQLEPGYEITVNEDSEATITFSVIVKAYAGEKVTNTGYYKVGDNPETPIDQPTNTVIVNVEDEATIIPTITTTTPVTVPQKAILVLDFSGSMDNSINGTTKITSLRKAVDTFLKNFLDGKNEVMIISYSKEASVQCNFTTSKDVAYASIENDKADGGTNIEAGLKLANSYITTANASTTSVILMTDGLPCYYTATYEWMGKEYEYIAQEGDGTAYAEKPATAAKNAATAIKNKGSKVYSIGFGLDSISNQNQSIDKAKALLQNIATPSEYNAEGALVRKYYYDTFDGKALEEAFKEITDSITTTANADPIQVNTDEGIITITKGFKEGQNVEIYTGTYNKDTSKPVATYTWEQFKALEYTTYASNQITFNLGKYMKDNGIAANTEVSLRFVDAAE